MLAPFLVLKRSLTAMLLNALARILAHNLLAFWYLKTRVLLRAYRR